MRHPILGALAKEALDRGFNVVRFNFRGVGESTGDHDDGIGEISDIASVADFIAREVPPLVGIAGWSFGAAAALIWQQQSASAVPYVGIAPPVNSPLTPPLPVPEALEASRRLFIVGERDQFVNVDALAVYAASIGAEFDAYPGSDHFFVFKHEKLATAVVDWIAG
jgi:alpha/beta superfamily hydrolase